MCVRGGGGGRGIRWMVVPENNCDEAAQISFHTVELLIVLQAYLFLGAQNCGQMLLPFLSNTVALHLRLSLTLELTHQ